MERIETDYFGPAYCSDESGFMADCESKGLCPKGAEVIAWGLFYKIGIMGKPFYWCLDQWRLSDKPVEVVKREIHKYKSRCHQLNLV